MDNVMKIKKNHNPVFGIAIAMAVLFTVIEGAFFILRVMENNLNRDMAAYDATLDQMLMWLETEKLTKDDLPAFYECVEDKRETALGGNVTVYLLSQDKRVIYGNFVRYQSIPIKKFYNSNEDFYEELEFYSVAERIFNSDNMLIQVESNQQEDVLDEMSPEEIEAYFESEEYPNEDEIEIDMDDVSHVSFLEDMESFEFVTDEIIYYEKKITLADGSNYILLFGKALTVSGRTMQQTIYLIIIYVAVLLIMWIISILQAIARADDYRRLLKVAYFDSLTKMINRTRFELEAKKLLKRRKQRNYAFIVVDIVRFKVFNDFYGEASSRDLLIQLGNVLKKETKRYELVAKDRDDIFLLLWICDTPELLRERIRNMDSNLQTIFSEKSVKFRYGIYRVQDYKQEIVRMVNFANIASERVANESNGIMASFDEKQWEEMRREKELENAMEEALKKREFVAYLQPKYLADGSKVGGAEALVRWKSSKFGFISPGQFIPLFEKNGFIMKLDNYMLDAVCRAQRKWLDEGRELITISVNISRVHLLVPELVDDIITTVDCYQLPHNCIELELTESAFFDNKEVLINTIHRLQAAGFEVSMDDFGSGYSSLNSLKDLPLDVIKLDCEFFRDSVDMARGETIVRDTIEMARDLNMRIVAEGIEKKEQVVFLNKAGCDLIQGFIFAKPMPIDDFEKMVYQTENKDK